MAFSYILLFTRETDANRIHINSMLKKTKLLNRDKFDLCADDRWSVVQEPMPASAFASCYYGFITAEGELIDIDSLGWKGLGKTRSECVEVMQLLLCAYMKKTTHSGLIATTVELHE